MAADYTISAYFRGADGVSVNLYVPSRLSWTQNTVRCTLEQETDYPAGSLVTLKMDAEKPVEFALRLRVPAWAGRGTSVAVNGKRETAAVKAGTFLTLQRTWKAGDRVELELDQPVRTEAVDAQHADQVAILRGPQVLFGISDKQPELMRDKLDKLQIAKGGDSGWALETEQGRVTLRPFYEIGLEAYQTYWKVTGAGAR